MKEVIDVNDDYLTRNSLIYNILLVDYFFVGL